MTPRMVLATERSWLVVAADGLLATFNDAGVLNPLDVKAAQTIARLLGETDDRVLLAAALAVRGTRYGHVCIRLDTVRDAVAVDGQDPEEIEQLPWPETEPWAEAVQASPLVTTTDPPLVYEQGRLYLARYHHYEQQVATLLLSRLSSPSGRGAERSEGGEGLSREGGIGDAGQRDAGSVTLPLREGRGSVSDRGEGRTDGGDGPSPLDRAAPGRSPRNGGITAGSEAEGETAGGPAISSPSGRGGERSEAGEGILSEASGAQPDEPGGPAISSPFGRGGERSEAGEGILSEASGAQPDEAGGPAIPSPSGRGGERSEAGEGLTKGRSSSSQSILTRLLGEDTRQHEAAQLALTSRVTVIAGGPGTGKTHTIAALLAALAAGDEFPTVAVAAPTGKAAARLGEALEAMSHEVADEAIATRLATVVPSTIHRLLGWTWDRARFAHNERNRLPHDLVIVDEMSMVSLPMAAKLLAAVRDDATVVLVGDPDQLESIEAGTVLADIVSAGQQTEYPSPTTWWCSTAATASRKTAQSPTLPQRSATATPSKP